MHDRYEDAPRGGRPRVTPAQIVGIGLVVASLGWAAWLLRDRPISEEVELLPGTVLPSSELAIVEAAFDRAQLVDHRTEAGRVWVPRPRQSAYMRALVDAEALTSEFGSSLRRALEKNSPWQSRAVQEEMLRVAVQDELSHVICSMPGVERAAVLYDISDRLTTGLAKGPEPTASVNVRTQAEVELEPDRVQAIRVLVAASIAGLEAERVAVTDLRSGRVFAGPLLVETAADTLAAADPALARRIVHERHLAGKLRQALAFVEGGVVDVTVTFNPPQPPQLPSPVSPVVSQRVAGANAPAEVGQPPAEEASVAPLPPDSKPMIAGDFPATILVSLAIPEAFFITAREARLSDDAIQQADDETEQRLCEHVLSLLPPTTRADGRQVVVTRFPIARKTAAADRSRPSASRLPSPVLSDTGVAPVTDQAVSLEAAWQAMLEGRPADVPREVWLGLIAVAAGLLGWLVLRPQRAAPRRPHDRHSTADRIDWGSIEDGSQAEAAPDSERRRQVAA